MKKKKEISIPNERIVTAPTFNFKHWTPEFQMGQIVYLRTDSDQLDRIVTGFNLRQSAITYCLANGTTESWHFNFEITADRDIIKATSN